MAARTVVRLGDLLRQLNKFKISNQQTRHGSYNVSPFVEDVKIITDYERVSNPPEWKHVEELIFPRVVQCYNPPDPDKQYPSGWRPRSRNADIAKYDVARTRNNMLPLYYDVRGRVPKRRTVIRKISGDVGALKCELKEYLKEKTQKEIFARADEVTGVIQIKGDHYYYVKDFLFQKGF